MKRLKMLFVLMSVVTLTSCSLPGVDAGEEMVLIQKPWFFGSGGVVDEPVVSGRALLAFSTEYEKYTRQPIKYSENFTDVITYDNNPVDFNAHIQIQLIKGKSPVLHEKFGRNWYENNIEDQFRSKIRGYCSKFQMFTLSTDRKIVDSLENVILLEMQDYIKTIDMPVKINQVIIGKVTPPKAVLLETVKTAAEKQAIKTQETRKHREIARESADIAKAKADMAYKNTFSGMTTNQYLYLRSLEIEMEKIEMVKGKNNVSINMVQGASALPTLPVGK